MKRYEVTWIFKLSKTIEAESAAEAIIIADDAGDTQADIVYTSPKHAKLVRTPK